MGNQYKEEGLRQQAKEGARAGLGREVKKKAEEKYCGGIRD